MKADLYYNPAGPWTQVMIDGSPVNPNDVYGFLYPVRRYLLQAWLLPSGSWPGLRTQLEELARGEALETVFHGRGLDYQDIAECLEGMEGVTLAFEPWRIESDPVKALGLIRALLDEQVVVERSGDQEKSRPWSELFPRQTGELSALLNQEQNDWLQIVDSERAFRQAQRLHGCCLVTGGYLTSYERLQDLRALTRSMRRAEDMIVCQLDSPDAARDYSDYARNTLGLRMRFVSSQDGSWKEALLEKYGRSFREQQSRAVCDQCMRILEACMEQKAELNARLRELRRHEEDSEDIRRLEGVQAGLRVLTHRLADIRELLESANTDFQEVRP